MFTVIFLFVIIFIIYQVVKPKGPKPIKMSAFDAYLIEQHKESQKRADAIPAVTFSNTTVNNKTKRDKPWIDDLYLGMIKSGEYDINALRKEAMEVMRVTESELDEMLEQCKIDKKKKR